MDENLDRDLNREYLEKDVSSVWHGFTQMSTYLDLSPIMVERADNFELIDANGKRYLDAISSLWVTTLGHNLEELNSAIISQVSRVSHSTLLGNGNTAVSDLGVKLKGVLPIEDGRIVFASDGAAAVEQALKIAVQYWINVGNHTKSTFLTLSNSYHGDTVGSISLGDGGFGTSIFSGLMFPVLRTPGYIDSNWRDKAVKKIQENHEKLAGLVIEPIVQGASGMYVANPQDVDYVIGVAKGLGVIVIADEVATGFGRTGKLFACDYLTNKPDIIAIGKGLTGGYLPMSATGASYRIYEAFLGEDLGPKTFYHGHSFSGNPVCSSVALRHLELFEEWNVLANVREMSSYLDDKLKDEIRPLKGVVEVRKFGLMTGIELSSLSEGPGRKARKVTKHAVENGVLIRPLGDVIVLMPILMMRHKQIDRIVSVLKNAILGCGSL